MAKDVIHNSVRAALVKDGWNITHDPFRIEFAELTLFADLAVERCLSEEQIERKIVIEIKSFIGRSFVEELQKALGQYTMYRNLLAETSPEYEIYLAINKAVYDNFFEQTAVQVIVEANELALLVVDIDHERVVTWTK